MAIPSSLITNISLSGIGLTVISGLVYGSYELLKHDPREVKDFLKVKKRTLLSTSGNDDEQAWKTNWAKYITDNTPKPTAPPPPKIPEAGKPASPQPPSAPEEPKKDIWNLDKWEEHKTKSDTVPQAFKTACTTKSQHKVNGIWDSTFKQVVDYCTKEIDGD